MRTEGWEKRFSDYLDKMRLKPFIWGENDCMMFAAKAYEVITGNNCYSQYGQYDSEESAMGIINSNGGLNNIIKKELGRGSKVILSAKRGDIALLKIPALTCGIVDDSGQFIAVPSEKGLVRYPLLKAWRIWSIE